MFWKIALGLGIFGLVLAVIIGLLSAKAFYAANEFTEDVPFIGLLIGIILLIFSFLLAAVSAIFVLRNSKKEWDAKNAK